MLIPVLGVGSLAVQNASMFTFQCHFISVKLAIWEASMARFVDSIEYVLQVCYSVDTNSFVHETFVKTGLEQNAMVLVTFF